MPLLSFDELQCSYAIYEGFPRDKSKLEEPNGSIKQAVDLESEVFGLRRNPPEVRVTSGQKPSTKNINIVLQSSVQLF